jgi:hypothetical protein
MPQAIVPTALVLPEARRAARHVTTHPFAARPTHACSLGRLPKLIWVGRTDLYPCPMLGYLWHLLKMGCSNAYPSGTTQAGTTKDDVDAVAPTQTLRARISGARDVATGLGEPRVRRTTELRCRVENLSSR